MHQVGYLDGSNQDRRSAKRKINGGEIQERALQEPDVTWTGFGTKNVLQPSNTFRVPWWHSG